MTIVEASSNSSTFWLGRTVALAKRCPLLALSGHFCASLSCPLLTQSRHPLPGADGVCLTVDAMPLTNFVGQVAFSRCKVLTTINLRRAGWLAPSSMQIGPMSAVTQNRQEALTSRSPAITLGTAKTNLSARLLLGPRQGTLPRVHQSTRRRRRGHSGRKIRTQEDRRVIVVPRFSGALLAEQSIWPVTNHPDASEGWASRKPTRSHKQSAQPTHANSIPVLNSISTEDRRP